MSLPETCGDCEFYVAEKALPYSGSCCKLHLLDEKLYVDDDCLPPSKCPLRAEEPATPTSMASTPSCYDIDDCSDLFDISEKFNIDHWGAEAISKIVRAKCCEHKDELQNYQGALVAIQRGIEIIKKRGGQR